MSLRIFWIACVAVQQVAATTTPAPLSAEPAKQWLGNDGLWSTWKLKVGTPAQTMQVVPAIAIQNTILVMNGGCPSYEEPANCETLRGEFYNSNDSRSYQAAKDIWKNGGLYEIVNQVAKPLGINPSGEFGLDVQDLDWKNNIHAPVNHTVVASIVDSRVYVGQLGMSQRPTNFTQSALDAGNTNDRRDSYLVLLKNNKLTPSLSYGLQVGSHSRQDQAGDLAYGSLIFGGYDTARMNGNSLAVDMSNDDGNEFKVLLQKVLLTNSTVSDTDTVNAPFYASLDTTQADIWLPKEYCEMFEAAFGLIWNDTYNRYALNEQMHESLLEQNASITFQLSKAIYDTGNLKITLPYSAFAYNLSAPISTPSVRYFPLRRGANSTQYVLGRAFMQEAYLVANYENATFSLYAASWDNKRPEHIVAIPASESTAAKPSASKAKVSLSKGALAGIIIGIGIAVLLSFAALVWCLRRQRKQREEAAEEEAKKEPYVYVPRGNRHEVEAEENQVYELPGEIYEHEADWGAERVELGGKEIIQEVVGSPIDHELASPEDEEEMIRRRREKEEQEQQLLQLQQQARARPRSTEESRVMREFNPVRAEPQQQEVETDPETPHPRRGSEVSPVADLAERPFEEGLAPLQRRPTIISPIVETPQAQERSLENALNALRRRPTDIISPIDEVPRGRGRATRRF